MPFYVAPEQVMKDRADFARKNVGRGIYPTVATITAGGFDRVEESEVAERFRALIERKTAQGQLP